MAMIQGWSETNLDHSFPVMAGLVPAIHVLCQAKTWMPGTRPGMTIEKSYAKRALT
jgi:hypothetical protein